MPARYDAVWIPGLNQEVDRDESIRVGLRWLASTEPMYETAGVIVMYAKSMAENAPLLSKAAQRWMFVSPRSKRPSGKGPVLAIWPPDSEVLEFAERMALDAALCVIAGRYDIGPWVRKARATCLMRGYEMGLSGPALHPEVISSLDAMLSFDGHNEFIGAGGKEDAIRQLQGIARRPDRPTPQAIEDYLFSSAETSAKGAKPRAQMV